MAEEKKPKIDLKARLGKTGVHQASVPPHAGGAAPVPAPSSGAPPAVGASVRPQTGVSVRPPPGFVKPAAPVALDPSNPLAAVAAPGRPQAIGAAAISAAPAAPAPLPQPQRIEVDEQAVQQARKGGLKQGITAGAVGAVVLAIVGFIAGGASETSKSHAKSVKDAQSLAEEVGKSREQLKTLAEKVEAGRDSLLKERKFPDTLSRDLGGLNIDFDGSKLAGVRFSGYSAQTSASLIEYITAVQGVNDRKTSLASVLSRLQKPITEQLTPGKPASISHVVILGNQDPSGNQFGILAPLTKAIEVANPQQISLPAELTATDPTRKANVKLPKYTGGSVEKGAIAYVAPASIEAAFPSESSGAIAQLAGQFSLLITAIRGDQTAQSADIVTETKPGLLEVADKLADALKKVE